jgi:hypothetical protein
MIHSGHSSFSSAPDLAPASSLGGASAIYGLGEGRSRRQLLGPHVDPSCAYDEINRRVRRAVPQPVMVVIVWLYPR